MHTVAHHHPVVATSSDSVTLVGARIALVCEAGERAAMPEVGEAASPGGGSAYLPPSHLSNAILEPTAHQTRKEEPNQIMTNRAKTNK